MFSRASDTVITCVVQVFGHGFLTKDGLKMGKALGNTLDPAALVQAYGPDAVRLFFMKEVSRAHNARVWGLCCGTNQGSMRQGRVALVQPAHQLQLRL
jgi:isoleucyl-tRNA synthetase